MNTATLRAFISMECLGFTRQGWQAASAFVFFLLMAFMEPYFSSPISASLEKEMPTASLPHLLGHGWLGLVFALMLSLNRLFQEDIKDGTLVRYYLAGIPLWVVALIKALLHWLLVGLPLCLFHVVLQELLQPAATSFSLADVSFRFLSLLTPWCGMALAALGFCCYGMMANAIACGSRASSALQPLITLPLYPPCLIFGVGAVSGNGLAQNSSFYYLGGFTLSALVVGVMVAAQALRFHVE